MAIELVEPEQLGMDGRMGGRIRDHMQRRYLDRRVMASAATLVSRAGRVGVLELQGHSDREAGTELREDQIYRIYSMTKPIVSVGLMMLYEEGRLLLEDPVQRFIPEFAKTRVWVGGSWPDYMTRRPDRPITVRDLLTHTSGLTYEFMRRTNVDYGYRKEGLGALTSKDSLQEVARKLAAMPLEFSPGGQWNYSMATDVVGRVIEVISGQPLDAYLQERIFEPLGMEDTGFWVPKDKLDRLGACYQIEPGQAESEVQDPAGAASAFARKPNFLSGGGGLVSTLADYHAFCAMLACGGTWNGARILGPHTLRLMFSNHLPDGADMTEVGVPSTFSEAPYSGVGFGLGFSVMMDPAKAQMTASLGEVGWGGLASTGFWVVPSEELAVIFMTQLIPSSSTPVRRELHALVGGGLH